MKKRPKNRPNNINEIWNTIENMDTPNDPEAGARLFASLFPDAKEENECRETQQAHKDNAPYERRR